MMLKMLTIKKTAIIVLVVFFAIYVLLRWFTWGTPWELYHAKNTAEQYLNDKYDVDMVVSGGTRFLRGTINMNAHPKYNPEINYVVQLQDGFVVKCDTYASACFSFELCQMIEGSIQKLFGNDSKTYCRVLGDAANSLGCLSGENPISAESISLLAEQYVFRVRTSYLVTADNADDCVDKLCQVIAVIHDHSLKPREINVELTTTENRTRNVTLLCDMGLEEIRKILSNR